MDGWVFKVPVGASADFEDAVVGEEIAWLRAQIRALQEQNSKLSDELSTATLTDIKAKIAVSVDLLGQVISALEELI